MDNKRHLAALERMNQRINDHDLDFGDDLYAPDIEWWYAGMPEPIRGREPLKQRDTATAAAFPDIKRDVINIVADERSVAVRWRIRATHAGEYAGLSATGNRIDVTGCSFFEFANGQVSRLAVYIDTPTLIRQVATTP